MTAFSSTPKLIPLEKGRKMGISLSKRPHDHQQHHDRPTPPPLLPTNPPPQLLQSPLPPTYAFAANAPLPFQQQQSYPNNNNNINNNYYPSFSHPQTQPNNNYNQSYYYSTPPLNFTPHPQYSNYATPYYNNVPPPPRVGGWGGQHPITTQQQILHPAPYVDHHNTKKVKNDVNVHKDTIKLQLDHHNNNDHSYLLSFTFDAIIDGSITIFYFAKEGMNCKFNPVYPEIPPVKIPFKKGLGQKFVQPSGTGVDLGFFAIDDLSKPSPEDDVYPLVISAGASEPSTPMDEHSNEKLVASSSHAQISQAVLEKKDGKDFAVKVIKQILWIDGVRYELQEIFGINNSSETTVGEVDAGKECVICMTEVKNTAVLPCRHMCMCSECAKELRLQSDKCPVCRQPIKELVEIKVDDEESEIQA